MQLQVQKNGHKDGATRKKPMGGCAYNKDWVKKWRDEPGVKDQKEIIVVNTINQITKNTAWTNSLPVDQTAFLDSAASIHLLHNRAAENIPKEQEKKNE